MMTMLMRGLRVRVRVYVYRWVKGSPIGVLFPVLIAFLAPLRVLLVKMKFFNDQEMAGLDTE